MIKIFTPSFADEADSNAQNLSVKEIVARLDPARFAVTMLREGAPDPRIAARPNTRLLHWRNHGNTARVMVHLLTHVPDIYFFPREGPLDAAFLKVRRALKLRTRLVTYVVSGGLYQQAYAENRQRNIREADGVVANNTYLAELLKDKIGIQTAAVIYDAADRRYFFPKEPSEPFRNLTVLFAGSLRPYKRVPMVVEQAARHPDVGFRIAGNGEEEQACRDLAAKLNCSNVEFLGHLSSAQLGEEMRRADIFFFPSIIEGHPQVLVQAAACGLPVVCSRMYRPDFVRDGITGFLADNDHEFSEKLDCLIRDRNLRTAMRSASISHAALYEWSGIARDWEEVFRRVLHGEGPSEVRA